ncbi:unnamed protein product [Heligmosomoides polygyrus]|uniref:Uncharacterized protein n=1 Tax=Heligmosomoides polygyrus TaxID=6339 RepID=A0A183F4Z7_HELPZ|nr:unnamed protein product [Heligmosomoides polygyrus]
MEVKMLRWTAGVTRMDRIRNYVIRQKFDVVSIADKMREARLRWYGYVLRRKEDSDRKIGLSFEGRLPPTKRPHADLQSPATPTDFEAAAESILRDDSVPTYLRPLLLFLTEDRKQLQGMVNFLKALQFFILSD